MRKWSRSKFFHIPIWEAGMSLLRFDWLRDGSTHLKTAEFSGVLAYLCSRRPGAFPQSISAVRECRQCFQLSQSGFDACNGTNNSPWFSS